MSDYMASEESTNRPLRIPERRQRGSGLHGNHVAHTLTACVRCRQRKTRCDAGLPRCGPCERNNAYCEYFDTAKGRKMPRSYVVRLQERVRELETELVVCTEKSRPSEVLDPEELVRGPGLVKIRDNNEPSFLGPSSGINMTRLVLELAKDIRKIKNIKELVPEEQARRIRVRFEAEAQKPTSKVYPEISSVAAPNLPSRELTDMLVENFFKKGQYLYPVLHEPSFRYIVHRVYRASDDAYENFALRIVIALSMQKLSSQWTGLADSYYLAALPFLEATIRRRNLGTLQAFMLIAQYSMVTPTRTAANWIVVLAVKLSQELGLTEEATIGVDKAGKPLDILEVDMRRRCYWICLAMEHGLAHSMGRPNAFGTPHTHLDVGWFCMVDDEYITRNGLLPAPVSLKKRISKHFISMRLLQLEIRRTLYLNRRPTPKDDQDPWFQQIEQKLESWLVNVPENSDDTGLNKEWFTTRHNTIVVFLFRPSPQIPQPSVRAARRAFEASKYNIEAQRRQIDEQKVDLTWVFSQSLFMAINTVLWALSYADIRKENPREGVTALLDRALECAYYCSLKWPGVEGAIELYGTLKHTCLKAYDGNVDQFYSVASPIDRPSPTTTGSPEPLPSPMSSEYEHQTKTAASSPPSPVEHHAGLTIPATKMEILRSRKNPYAHLSGSDAVARKGAFGSHVASRSTYQPMSFGNPLPHVVVPCIGALVPENLYSPMPNHYTSIGPAHDSYARLVVSGWPQAHPGLGLNLQQQSELMDKLELGKMNGLFG